MCAQPRKHSCIFATTVVRITNVHADDGAEQESIHMVSVVGAHRDGHTYTRPSRECPLDANVAGGARFFFSQCWATTQNERMAECITSNNSNTHAGDAYHVVPLILRVH
jgi:hypothetical protein